MEKLFYDAESLRRSIAVYERTYGMSSEDFVAARSAGETLTVPHFEAHVWAGLWSEVKRLEESNPTEQVGRIFAHA